MSRLVSLVHVQHDAPLLMLTCAQLTLGMETIGTDRPRWRAGPDILALVRRIQPDGVRWEESVAVRRRFRF